MLSYYYEWKLFLNVPRFQVVLLFNGTPSLLHNDMHGALDNEVLFVDLSLHHVHAEGGRSATCICGFALSHVRN